MLRSPSGDSGGFTRHLRRCFGSHGKLLCFLFKLPRGIKHSLDDSADLGAEILDKLIKLCPTLICRKLVVTRAFDLKLPALDAVVFENADGPGDCADFVMPLGVLDVDVRPSLGESGQRF